MVSRRRASISLWQTGLFIVVIVVAILILSGSLSASLRTTLTDMAKASELRNASALARRIEPEFPVTVESLDRVREVLAEYRGIYAAGIWVYDRDGTLLEASYDTAPPESELEKARLGGLAENPPYASMDLSPGGWVVAAKALRGSEGSREGVVVTASPVTESLAILDSVRSRLWVTFWASLAIAGALGFGFSYFISRRIRAMSDAATAIAGGDFQQRLPTGWVPNEVQDLAESYNTMAVTLGDAFGAIEENRREIAAVVESMAEGVVAFDSTGAVRVMNPEAMRLFDLPGRDGVGEPAETLTTESEVLDVVHAGLGGESMARTVCLGQFTVLLHCTPLLDADGSVDGAVLLLADVTEQVRIEEAQRRFVADASHEMRTPIAALKGMLELLADGAKDDPEVRDDFIQTMQFEADRLGRLVIDLLTLAQLEAGSLRLDIAPQSAADLLGDVASVMQTLAEQAAIDLSVEVPDGDIQVLADRDKMVQVLLSFTDNALKHSPKGSTIHLRVARKNGAALLEVADEGEGIGSEQLASVFERFYRADTSRGGGSGAGLGLAIAKEIVEAHGSSIEVHSAPHVGTTFGFELPFASETRES
jgi:signal transduction histidine kinase